LIIRCPFKELYLGHAALVSHTDGAIPAFVTAYFYSVYEFKFVVDIAPKSHADTMMTYSG